MGEDNERELRFYTLSGGTIGNVDMNTNPPWIYGEEGVLLPFEPDEPEYEAISMDWTENKRLLWRIKWELLKTALVFFFTRW